MDLERPLPRIAVIGMDQHIERRIRSTPRSQVRRGLVAGSPCKVLGDSGMAPVIVTQLRW